MYGKDSFVKCPTLRERKNQDILLSSLLYRQIGKSQSDFRQEFPVFLQIVLCFALAAWVSGRAASQCETILPCICRHDSGKRIGEAVA